MSFKKVLLVKPSGRHGLSYAFDLIPAGLEYLAAMIEDVVEEVTIVDLEMEHRPFDEVFNELLIALRPDLVGISMSATDHSEGLEIARLAKSKGAVTLLGGYHPTAIPMSCCLSLRWTWWSAGRVSSPCGSLSSKECLRECEASLTRTGVISSITLIESSLRIWTACRSLLGILEGTPMAQG